MLQLGGWDYAVHSAPNLSIAYADVRVTSFLRAVWLHSIARSAHQCRSAKRHMGIVAIQKGIDITHTNTTEYQVGKPN
jgi:hypothetical protein